MPPFWVTTKPPSAASAAPLAPPPVSAIVSRRPVSGHTRSSVPLSDAGAHEGALGRLRCPAGTTPGLRRTPVLSQIDVRSVHRPHPPPERPHRRSGPRGTVAAAPPGHAPSAVRQEHAHDPSGNARRAQGRADGSRARSRKRCARTRSRASPRASPLVDGVIGYEDTVIPQLENALLAGHDVIFLGERGQAKTRMIRSLTAPARRVDADRRRQRDQRRPVPPDLAARARARRRARRRDADRVGAPRPPLRREAGHARHLDRRPHRRGRPDQGRRGPLPLRRAHHPLRPGAAHQPRHLRDQRAPRPRRAHPGRSAQRARGARRPDPRLQGPAAARRHAASRRRTPRTTPTAAASSRR